MSLPQRVTLVHDWLTGMRGGEKVLEVFCQLFPDAPIHTLVHVPGSVSPVIESHRIVASPLKHLPGSGRHYRYYLPLMPALVESMRLRECDLVLSTSSAVVKGVRAPGNARHAAYVFSPMRYLYDRYDDYFAAGRSGRATRMAMRLCRGPLRAWDRATARRITSMRTISRFVATRIREAYGFTPPVIYPPVDTARFARHSRAVDDYYLMVCALVPYKNVDVAIEAFRGTGRRLIVAGSGPLFASLKATCPPNVELRGWVDDSELLDLVAGCRAFLFPNVEDYGIAPVEAMAAGRPVIALAAGGGLETVVDPETNGDAYPHPTGVFFDRAEPAALAEAIARFEREESHFRPARIREWARRFDRQVFIDRVTHWLRGIASGAPSFLAAEDQTGILRAG